MYCLKKKKNTHTHLFPQWRNNRQVVPNRCSVAASQREVWESCHALVLLSSSSFYSCLPPPPPVVLFSPSSLASSSSSSSPSCHLLHLVLLLSFPPSPSFSRSPLSISNFLLRYCSSSFFLLLFLFESKSSSLMHLLSQTGFPRRVGGGSSSHQVLSLCWCFPAVSSGDGLLISSFCLIKGKNNETFYNRCVNEDKSWCRLAVIINEKHRRSDYRFKVPTASGGWLHWFQKEIWLYRSIWANDATSNSPYIRL